jgi:hypothetical protein
MKLDLKIVFAFFGLAVGLVAVLVGIGHAFVLALFIVAGWLIGKIAMGELNPVELYKSFKASRDEKRRDKF